jgi:hypothetical protein
MKEPPLSEFLRLLRHQPGPQWQMEIISQMLGNPPTSPGAKIAEAGRELERKLQPSPLPSLGSPKG